MWASGATVRVFDGLVLATHFRAIEDSDPATHRRIESLRRKRRSNLENAFTRVSGFD